MELYKLVQISKKFHKKIKKRSAEEEKTITQILREILEKEFTQKEK